ncbi:hypothetical protein [Lactiplantibacillus plajomi]|uniref:Uncharacterized protein n=1 Tax=Lactiplantibacillus plajomi TaxID=1457217 RepID=A0ABV6K478_9LACO|nr:hypothetical protein [Lactiplantibacillus plajomi]
MDSISKKMNQIKIQKMGIGLVNAPSPKEPKTQRFLTATLFEAYKELDCLEHELNQLRGFE